MGKGEGVGGSGKQLANAAGRQHKMA